MPGWIKICGVRELLSAQRALAVEPDFLGLNFVAKSPRLIAVAEASSIVDLLRHARRTEPVAVFVNHTLEEIQLIADQVAFTSIQLHGDEVPEFVRSIRDQHPDWKIFKAFRVGESLQPVADFVSQCERLDVPLAGCLLDAKIEGSYGGTGTLAPWKLIARDYDRASWPPLFLAGGLTPENVGEAIAIVRPLGVDTASGVESSPGVKDTTLLARFVAEARRAFALVQGNAE